MKLNTFEKLLMNNPVRAQIQQRYEARRLLALGGPMNGGKALEVGCGRGVGAAIILEQFGAESVDGLDLDPAMVALARERTSAFGSRVKLWVGDAERIDAPANHYDAVFDFGIIHHIPNWRGAIRDIHRVLKPNGRLYAEEVLKSFIHSPLWRRLLDHPMEDRFDQAGFSAALQEAGFVEIRESGLWDRFAWYSAVKRA